MNNELPEALLDFYQKILAPEFESIQKKQAAHDGKFIDILGHFDDLYKHMHFPQMQSRLEAIEREVTSKGSCS